MISARARRALGFGLVAAAIAVLAWQVVDAMTPLREADICAKGVAEARAMTPSTEGPSRAAIVAKACAPLYTEPRCRQAHEKFDLPHPAERARTLAEACRDAYCPKLSEPKPALCAGDRWPMKPSDLAHAWSEFVPLVLAADHGLKAKPAIDALKAKD